MAVLIAGCHHTAQADALGYTIKDTETLYQECKKAQVDYKDRPDEIGNSVCGIYIQGFLGGYGISSINIFSKMPNPDKDLYLMEFGKDNCISASYSIENFISDFIKWRERHLDFNDGPYSAFLASTLESDACTKKGVNFNRMWGKKNG
jgi:hypothetical protein